VRRLICLLPLLILTACSRQLENGLTEKDAQEIVVVLRQHGIEAETQLDAADKKGSTWDVTVKGGSDKLVEAWNVLRENGLPRDKQSGLEDVYANAGMIPTASEEKARLLVGLSGEL
jgi:type III secretion protein J